MLKNLISHRRPAVVGFPTKFRQERIPAGAGEGFFNSAIGVESSNIGIE
jgi:hypothetical protein